MTRRLAGIGGALLLTGCASVNPRPAFDALQADVKRDVRGEVAWARSPAEAAAVDAIVDQALAGPLTVDAAVRVALLNNPGLQATFEELGISQAALAQASRVENPELTGLFRFPATGSGRNTELSLVQNVFDLFLHPLRKKLAAGELEQARLRITNEVLDLAAHVKEACFTLQAREQLVSRLQVIRDLTEAAAQFAQKQHEAGTINDLDLENQVVVHRQSKVDVALAQADWRADRERLNRLLGLWGPRTAWTFGEGLAPIPDQEIPLSGLERLAVTRRQDLRAARWGVDLVGRALALRRRTRFLPVGLHLGVNTEKEVSGERLSGPELALQLPLFDLGGASIARLEAEHRRAQRQLEALAVHARSEVRETHDRMLAARDLATYYSAVLLPQRLRILELTLRHYNAMFKGAYDLLLAKQAEVEAERAHLDAWRDYWILRARLERALGGALPEGTPRVDGEPSEGR